MTTPATSEFPSAAAALEQMPSGIYLPLNATRSSLRIVVEATDHMDPDIPELVDKFAFAQLKHPYVKPIFLISALNPAELTRAGFIYETVVPESTWNDLDMPATYREYRERRFHEMIEVYQAQRMGSIRPGQEIPRWMYER